LFIFQGGVVERRIKRRLQRLDGKKPGSARNGDRPMQLRRREIYSTNPGIDRFLKQWMPNPAVLHNRLARTGRNITVARYLAANLVLVLLIAVGLWLLRLPPLVAILCGIAAGIGLPHFLIASLIGRRNAAFTNQFPEAIDLMVRGIRAGLPIVETITVVAQEMSEPIRTEFRRMVDALQVGQAFDETLWAAAKRIESPEFRFFVVSLSIQRETGGNLAETLENLSDILRRRRQLKLKVRAVSSEARASAWVVGVLPFLLGTVMTMINSHYMSPLFHTHEGHTFLAVGLGCFAIGVVVLTKMVRFQI
jgi:tight adherence protein B